ncbi:ABC transporter permease [Motilibacter aurantiacus]|uniref:ABC transporter permease n=1 Tax=Motilibacter aurantiacus TaxID=2714955 RepID=UPI002F2B205C
MTRASTVPRRTAWAAAVVLAVIVLACLAAPLYAGHVAHTDAFASNVSGSTVVDGQVVPVLQPMTEGLGLGVVPIGPTGDPRHYLLGADGQGRDVAARLLFGGRLSLGIAAGATVLCAVIAVPLGLLAGYVGGALDAIVSRALDLVWAFPVYLLTVSLSVVLLAGEARLGPVHLGAGSLAVPVAVIALGYVPYVALPLRAQARAVRETDYVRLARALGASHLHVLRRHLLPAALPSLVAVLPVLAALSLLAEAALSFLSVGVQSPRASWGTVLNDGLALLYTRPAVTVAPGLLIVSTAVCLNLLADAARNAADPSRPGPAVASRVEHG